MSATSASARTRTTPRLSASLWSRWWVWSLTAAGGLLLLALLGLAVARRTLEDARFDDQWWTPIATSPPAVLLIASLGLDLAVATGLVALLLALPHRRFQPPQVARAAAVLLVAVGIALAWTAEASRNADTSVRTIRDGILGPPGRTDGAAAEVRDVIQLELAIPGSTLAGLRLRPGSSAPAGPWILQSTSVFDRNDSDEAEDIGVDTLVDPLTGHAVAAWFYGAD